MEVKKILTCLNFYFIIDLISAIRESQCLLNMYALCLIILIVLQVLLAIFVLVYNRDIQTAALQGWDRLWSSRQVTDINQKTIDQIQRTIQCCGSYAPIDYGAIPPASCCSADAQQCNALYAYTSGCRPTIQNAIHDYAQYLAYLSLIMAAVEVN